MKVFYERVYGFLTDIRLIRGTYKGEQKRQIFRAYLSFYLQRLMKGSSNVTVDVLGYTMQVPDFHMLFEMFKEIFIRNTYHFSTTEKAPRIIDCGGNIGMSVLYFKWLYPDAKITVFEPSPSTVKILRNNIERNAFKDVEVVNEALGEKVGTISLFSRIGDRTGGGATTMKEVVDEKGRVLGTEYTETKIDCTLLSPYITTKVSMLKLDIEGAEGAVFRELEQAGAFSKIDRVVMEYHYSHENKGNTPSEMIGRLERMGYIVQIFFNDPEPKNTRNHYQPVWHCILLAWRPETVA